MDILIALGVLFAIGMYLVIGAKRKEEEWVRPDENGLMPWQRVCGEERGEI